MIVKTYVPEYAGRPKDAPSLSPGPIRFGPTTEPTVVAQITIDMVRARAAGVAFSAAAYLDWRLTAWATPNRASPPKSNTTLLTTAARMTIPAPRMGTTHPTPSDMRRPRRAARFASGTAAKPAPNEVTAWANPATSVLAICSANKVTTATEAATPTPPKRLEATNVITFRRRVISLSRVVPTPSYTVGSIVRETVHPLRAYLLTSC